MLIRLQKYRKYVKSKTKMKYFCTLPIKISTMDFAEKAPSLARLRLIDTTTEIEIWQYLHYHSLSKRTEISSAVITEINDRFL